MRAALSVTMLIVAACGGTNLGIRPAHHYLPAPAVHMAPAPQILAAYQPPAVVPPREPPAIPPIVIELPSGVGTESPTEEGVDQLLQKALDDAQRTADDAVLRKALESYVFDPNEIYRVFCAVGAETAIVLEPGEKRTEKELQGEWTGWADWKEIDVGDGTGSGDLIHEVTFSPKKAAKPLRVTLRTNYRAIVLDLIPRPRGSSYNPRVRFPMPALEQRRIAEQQIVRQQQALELPVEREEKSGCTSAQYAPPEILSGNPSWVEGMFTWRECKGRLVSVHIQFQRGIEHRKVPGVLTNGAGQVHHEYDDRQRVLTIKGWVTEVELFYGCGQGQPCERVRIRALEEP